MANRTGFSMAVRQELNTVVMTKVAQASAAVLKIFLFID